MKLSSLIFLLIFAVISINLYSQKRDANWLLGYEDTILGATCGKILIHKNEEGLEYEFIDTPLNFEKTSAAISDNNGDLLLYTNGCSVANANHEIIKNGEGLNPGEIHNDVCEKYGYIISKGAMILPFPDSQSKYIILHLGAKNCKLKQICYDRFYYTLVDMNLNEGQGEVLEKNQILIEGDLESFAVTKHGNGRDWWIIVPEYGTNIYHRILLDNTGFHNYELQNIGNNFSIESCTFSSNSVFSPDGSYFCRANTNCGIIVFEFNRCNGFLNNPKYYYLSRSRNISGGEIAINNENELFFISPEHIPHYDYAFKDRILKLNLDKMGIILPSVFTFKTYDNYDVKPGHFIQYNDGELLFYSTKNLGTFYKIIENDINKDTILFEKFKKLPVLNAQSSPYFPNFQLQALSNSPCDSLTSNTNIYSSSIKIYPNPTSSSIFLKNNGKINGFLMLYSLNGRLLKTINCKNQNCNSINIKDIPNGIYFLKHKDNTNIDVFKIIKN